MNKTDFSILYAEDDQLVSQMLSSVLEDYFKNVYAAKDGQEALEIYEKEQIDIVLTDIRMPNLDGMELIKTIREKDKDIPIIVCSAHNDTQYLLESIQYKIDRYIIKPIDLDILEEVLEKILELLNIKKKIEKLQEKLSKQNDFLHMVLNTQATMIALFNKDCELTFANKTLLDFYLCENIEELKKEYQSIEKTFIENDNYFNLGKVKENENWIESLKKAAPSEKIVSIICHKTMSIKAFKITIAQHEETIVLTFTDISETFLKQLQLKDKTIHDKLTGAFNREYFEDNYEKLISKFVDETYSFGIAILDIDYFKNVNDTYGHDVGDNILVDFVKIIKKYSRMDDYLIRWGGEEFIFILKIKNYTDLEISLEKLRKNIENSNFSKNIKITCSCGGTIHSLNEDIKDTIKRADEALYNAKNTGRNKVIIKEF